MRMPVLALTEVRRRAELLLYILRDLPLPLLVASAIGYGLMLLQNMTLVTPALCVSPIATSGMSPATFLEAVRAALAFNSPLALGLAWFAMMLAMMPPLLAQPVRYLWRRSLQRRQVRAVALFAIGYAAIWLVAGALLTIAALAIVIVLASTAWPWLLAILVSAGLVFGWAVMPFRQFCLNQCHRRPSVAAFGATADADALRYGVMHGAWCIGTCWPLMLLPLLAGSWHLPVMAAVSLYVVLQRYRAPRPARWGLSSVIVAGLTRIDLIVRNVFTRDLLGTTVIAQCPPILSQDRTPP